MSDVKTYSVVLAGNPNVGKSTLFNQLTGLRQHTGNWPGKTVELARGEYDFNDKKYFITDLPGTYSLMAYSEDEEVAGDFICFEENDVTVVVADATALERNLNLALQVFEITNNVVLCINLVDEAEKKGIHIDIDKLKKKLAVPVVEIVAREKKGVMGLLSQIEKSVSKKDLNEKKIVEYPEVIEKAAALIAANLNLKNINSRWVALKILENNRSIIDKISEKFSLDINEEPLSRSIEEAKKLMKNEGLCGIDINDICVYETVKKAEEIAGECVFFFSEKHDENTKIDKILTSKYTGIPIMLLMLCGIFWITITGANYPSALLAKVLFGLEDILHKLMENAPEFIKGILIDGMYHTLAWVVSVMLPPMAIFFPLFAILEDSGYLPRIAFNLDNLFKKANAHGRQALTMCQGFGCNACGVMGSRIINSPRERLIAILTNNLVPCNGRFPTIIVLISIFMAGGNGILSSAILLGVIIMGVGATLFVSKFLSKTLLKGEPSSFVMELPPYRKPQYLKVIVRSFLDRTLFVLSRAIIVSLPAGGVIWLCANIFIGDLSLLSICGNLLEPVASVMGLDGYILLAFILGFPANEIVMPIIIMCYTASGQMTDYTNILWLGKLLEQNGWTVVTAVCFIVFSVMHFPCATTCQTIYKETKSVYWTIAAFFIPTFCGFTLCTIINFILKLL